MNILNAMRVFLFFLSIVKVFQADTPYDCGAHGYCYPANRTSSTTCSGGCVCPDGSSMVSEEECEWSENCSCTESHQKCEIIDEEAVCTCEEGYTGLDCSMLTSDPCSVTPCLQNGECSSSGSNYTCDCDDGYYGDQCQYSGDPCNEFCQNGGTCELIFNQTKPYCYCPFDYYGRYCQKERDVDTSYVGCFDDTSADFSDYYVYSTSSGSGSDCRDSLLEYRENNPESTYSYSTMSGTNQQCLFSKENTLTDTAEYSDWDIFASLLQTCSYSTVSAGMASVYSLNDMCTSEPCGDYGKCVQSSATTFNCVCSPLKSGSTCTNDTNLSPCDDIDCGATGTCQVTDDMVGYYCMCTNTNQTEACDEDPCVDKPCLYGGTCIDLGNGSYSCECLNLYRDENCSVFESCYINKCQNGGTCIPTYNLLNSTYTCNCTSDWKGSDCEEEKLPCDNEPCKNEGECEDIIGPPNSYNCTCTDEWEGQNCTEDFNECIDDDSLCKSVDEEAECVNTNGSYWCNCSSQYFGNDCSYNIIIYEILNATYSGLDENDFEEMVSELTEDPTVVRDMIPFLIGGYSEEVRESLSWSAEDMFLWAAYEQQLIDLSLQFVQWNDKVLGNCFTFNHINSSLMYFARQPGFAGGLEVQTVLGQNEYLPWAETASIMVFMAKTNTTITSESARVNCAPEFECRIAISREDYYRLGGKYGECVDSNGDSGSYYYDGEYTTDGCIRSCYQDVVEKECECMDPRYPMPSNSTTCDITKKRCIDNLVDERGDPSQWEECNCPLPCSETVYSSKLSRAPYTESLLDSCQKNSCTENLTDSAYLMIALPKLDFLIYQETALMDFNKFLSYLGGILSILIGVSIVSFVELTFLIIQLILIFVFNYKF